MAKLNWASVPRPSFAVRMVLVMFSPWTLRNMVRQSGNQTLHLKRGWPLYLCTSPTEALVQGNILIYSKNTHPFRIPLPCLEQSVWVFVTLEALNISKREQKNLNGQRMTAAGWDGGSWFAVSTSEGKSRKEKKTNFNLFRLISELALYRRGHRAPVKQKVLWWSIPKCEVDTKYMIVTFTTGLMMFY